MLWKLLHTYEKQWRPFTIGALGEERDDQANKWQLVREEDITAVEKEEQATEAYYAAWPIQAYIEG